jgi:hypothetical protein
VGQKRVHVRTSILKIEPEEQIQQQSPRQQKMPESSVYSCTCMWNGVLDVKRITDDVESTKVG